MKKITTNVNFEFFSGKGEDINEINKTFCIGEMRSQMARINIP